MLPISGREDAAALCREDAPPIFFVLPKKMRRARWKRKRLATNLRARRKLAQYGSRIRRGYSCYWQTVLRSAPFLLKLDGMLERQNQDFTLVSTPCCRALEHDGASRFAVGRDDSARRLPVPA